MHLFPKTVATEPIIRICIAYIMVGVLCSAHDTATGSNAPTTNYEQWFTAIIQNKPCGWLHITEIHTGDQIETIENTQISLRRGSLLMTITMAERFNETIDGTPIEAHGSQTLSGVKTFSKMQFTKDSITYTTGHDRQSRSITIDQQGNDWLPPAAANRFLRDHLSAGSELIEYQRISPIQGPQPTTITHQIHGGQQIEVMGRFVPAVEIKTTSSSTPGITTRNFVDTNGRLLKTSMNIGLWKIDMVASDQQLAQKQINPPEFMTGTFIKADHPISRPRKIRSALYEIQVKGSPTAASQEERQIILPLSGYQRIVSTAEDRIQVKVDTNHLEKYSPVPPDHTYRDPSNIIDWDDPIISSLLAQALDREDITAANNRNTAQKLCRFVHGYIDKRDLSVGFASAGEVARTRRGDCTEFAVLLASLLRAIDIPSRIASGLVYADQFMGHRQIFGYHMWTQAWIGGKDGCWIDFDAALNPNQFDATHIGITTSSLADGQYTNDLVRMVPILGRIDVKILKLQGNSVDAN